MAARVVAAALALFLCTTTVVSAPPYMPTPTSATHPPHRQCPGGAADGGESSEYKVYIVLLKPRPEYTDAGKDDSARRSWYLSFLPGETTADGKPRLVHSYKNVFDGFGALLTEDELDAVSKKPGFWSCFPNLISHVDDRMM